MHGTKGELKVQIFDERLEDFLKNEVVFLQIRGKEVPFFVEDYNEKLSTVRFEEVHSGETALPLTSTEMRLRRKDLIPTDEREWEVSEGLQYRYLEGFLVVDKTAGEIGKIKEVLDFPQQEMAVVDYDGKDLLVPMNDHLFIQIDEANSQLEVDLPEGLLNL